MTTSTDVDPRVPWETRAACADEDPDLFFLPDQSGVRRRAIEDEYADQISDAKAICATCPVIDRCLTAALAVPVTLDRWAIAGGATPDERVQIRSDRAAIARAQAAPARSRFKGEGEPS